MIEKDGGDVLWFSSPEPSDIYMHYQIIGRGGVGSSQFAGPGSP